MKKRTYVLILALIFVVLLLAAGAAVLFMSFDRTPSIPAFSYLDVRLSGSIVDFPDAFPWLGFLSSRPQSIHEIWTVLRTARRDARIQGVFLKIGLLQCDWAKCAEIRDAILDFRRSGKPVVAYLEEMPEADKEYYLATAADRIVLHPLGWLGINGLGGYVPFFKQSLDRLGIRAEFEHVEEYKTAYNQFTETGFTPAHREMLESILRSQFEEYIRTAAAARNLTEEAFRDLVDQAFFQGGEAKEAGLVDDVLYEDQAVGSLIRDGRPLKSVPLASYARIDPASMGLNTGRRVALVYGQGPIHGGASLAQTMGSETLARWFREIREDASIVAVVFRVDSPGGSAVASDAIWREIALTREKKPVVVSMSDLAGSGGYWVALGGHKIVAQPQTLTGSIGVLSGKFDFSGLAGKLGVTSEKVAFGDKADIYSPFRPLSADERALFKKQILWIYDRFTARTAESRNLTPEAVDEAGRGRVWTGRQAMERGLIDELGGIPKAIEMAKALAGIPPEEEIRLVVRPLRTSLVEALFGRRAVETAPAAARILPEEFRRALEWATRMNRERIWAVMPFLPAF